MEVQCFEIKTEADSNDSILRSHDDKPSTGMFTVSDSRGLVVTSGTLPEPSSQLIHNRCIDEEIKSSRTQKPTFTELELNTNLLLKALTTQTSNNPSSLANSCPVPIDKIFVMLQKTFHLIYFHRIVCTMLKCDFMFFFQ